MSRLMVCPTRASRASSNPVAWNFSLLINVTFAVVQSIHIEIGAPITTLTSNVIDADRTDAQMITHTPHPDHIHGCHKQRSSVMNNAKEVVERYIAAWN